MTRILAIDPGTVRSATVVLEDGVPVDHAVSPNESVLEALRSGWPQPVDAVVIEKVESYGMAVGWEVFETVRWAGRFEEACRGARVRYLPRRVVKLVLCSSVRATDANVWQAVLDRFGGKDAAVGRKSAPGPLYGIHGDGRAALAVALAWVDPIRQEYQEEQP